MTRPTSANAPVWALLPRSTLREVPVPALRNMDIRGVWKTKNGNIVVCAHTDNNAEKILAYADAWVQLLEPKAAIDVRVVSVVADFVSTKFEPANANAICTIYEANQGVFRDAASIHAVSWITKIETKNWSSLRIAIVDVNAADDLILRGISIGGAIHPVRKYVPSAAQHLERPICV
ncbi:hypothetical protein BDZ89DRAFT_1145775 [Hymenopellis radicata]|nr:hypothetical protein BDZ89DRAFT_1145775 [Hymenopellis radicata]